MVKKNKKMMKIENLERYPFFKITFESNNKTKEIFLNFCEVFDRDPYSLIELLESLLESKANGTTRVEIFDKTFDTEVMHLLGTCSGLEIDQLLECFLGKIKKRGDMFKGDPERLCYYWQW